MENDENRSISRIAAEMRRQAEERMRTKTVVLQPARSEEESQKILHELEVNQIELEMQNVELRHVQEDLELSRNKYAELYDFAPVGYFTFDRHGLIREVNLSGAQLLGLERGLLTGESFSLFIDDMDGKNIFSQHLESVLHRQGIQRCEIRLAGKNGAVIYGQLQSVAVDAKDCNDGYILSSIVDGTMAKQLETEIQDAREYAESIIETMRRPLVVLDSALKIISANPSFYYTFNVTAEETIGNFIQDLGNRQWDIPELSLLLEGILQENRGFNSYEVEHDFPGIGRRIILLNARRILRKNNSSHNILLAMEDITERRQAEEALLKSGALQRAIFNSANFSSIATDARGVIQIFNVGAERMLGYTAAEVMDRITPADISDPQEVVARAAALSIELETPIRPGFEALVFKASRGIEDIYELTYIRKDGSRFPAVVSVTALRDEHDAIIGYLLIGTDNTARKQVEAEQEKLSQSLRDHQFYTRSLFESNIDAIMTTDPAGIITDVNKQMEVLTGSTRDELIGVPFKNYFTDQGRAEASIKLVLGEKKVTDYELTARARDGKETVVSFNATTFYDRDRKLQGVFAAARDITERKRLDQVLQEKNVELEGARTVAEKTNLAKSDFLANMSHELRTPLNSVIGFSEVLQDQMFGPVNEKQKEYLTNILTSGKHLLSLINDILDLSKVESGKMELEVSDFSLRESLDASLMMLREKALKNGITLKMELAPEADVRILADQRKLKQIMFNLLTNAVKFTPAGGTVDVNGERDGDFIKITVADTGLGIKKEDIPKLFQTFTQLESVYTKEYEGTGLGLALTRRLVELQGGRIWVKSLFGMGSRFSFTIPLAQSAGNVFLANRLTNAPGNGTTVLLIEDEPLTLDALEKALESNGYRVLRADDGEKGFEMALHEAPDLIVLDLIMPGMNGFDIADRLLSVNDAMKIPILVLTAMDLSAADRERLEGKVWRIAEKGSLSTQDLINLVESAKSADRGR
jgi:PAS domain S-box-containing protein